MGEETGRRQHAALPGFDPVKDNLPAAFGRLRHLDRTLDQQKQIVGDKVRAENLGAGGERDHHAALDQRLLDGIRQAVQPFKTLDPGALAHAHALSVAGVAAGFPKAEG